MQPLLCLLELGRQRTLPVRVARWARGRRRRRRAARGHAGRTFITTLLLLDRARAHAPAAGAGAGAPGARACAVERRLESLVLGGQVLVLVPQPLDRPHRCLQPLPTALAALAARAARARPPACVGAVALALDFSLGFAHRVLEAGFVALQLPQPPVVGVGLGAQPVALDLELLGLLPCLDYLLLGLQLLLLQLLVHDAQLVVQLHHLIAKRLVVLDARVLLLLLVCEVLLEVGHLGLLKLALEVDDRQAQGRDLLVLRAELLLQVLDLLVQRCVLAGRRR
mmetsp:Transcript_6448/g.15204  ORF Transcript_6448/g.15204 Transcript_6448/m.15204 type:complete len:281 (-) Transcript_6448:3804-4646(-)